jgi:hypothetical protein
MKYFMSDAEIANRKKARCDILDAVNKGRDKPLRMRHIQRAAHVARHQKLVKKNVLVAVGFNPTSR